MGTGDLTGLIPVSISGLWDLWNASKFSRHFFVTLQKISITEASWKRRSLGLEHNQLYALATQNILDWEFLSLYYCSSPLNCSRKGSKLTKNPANNLIIRLGNWFLLTFWFPLFTNTLTGTFFVKSVKFVKSYGFFWFYLITCNNFDQFSALQAPVQKFHVRFREKSRLSNPETEVARRRGHLGSRTRRLSQMSRWKNYLWTDQR